jgi:hypothetical protein
VVTGATTITAGSGAVTLTNAGNDFANIGVSGGAVSITDANALALNGINAASLTINTSAGNGAVTQAAGVLLVPGATAVNAGTGPVTLNAAGNDFGSFGTTGGAITVRDANTLALDAINATSLTLNTGGAITQNAAAIVTGATAANAGANAITLNNAGNNFGSVGGTGGAVSITDINALALDAINASSLTVNTSAGNGAVTQNAAAIVTWATTVNAGSGGVTLANAGNNFGSVGATGGAVSITDINALALDAINATSLTVNTSAGNGAITQNAAAIVSGVSNINAGTGAVTLANAGNDFANLGVTGGAISVLDSNALALTSLTSAPNQAVSVSAGGALTLPATAIDTGSATLSLSSGGALTSVGTLRGTNVALTSGATLTLANNLTSLGTLSLTSVNSAITQTAGAIVAAGATTVNAGSGDVTLAQAGNDFQGSLAVTGGAISVRDANDLTLTSLVSGVNQPVSVIAGGSLVLPPNPIATGSADLTLQALGGSLVVDSALSGNNVTLTGSAGINLGANVTSTGNQIYTTPLQLSGNVTLNAGASRIDLQGGANGAGNSLALISSNAGANAVQTDAPITNTAQFTITGNSTLGGNVTTTGNQTYTGAVVLGSDIALAAGSGNVTFGSTVDSGAGPAHGLIVTSAGTTSFAGAVGSTQPLSLLTINGPSQLGTSIVTSGAQSYAGASTLVVDSTLTGASVSFGSTLDGAHALTVNAVNTSFGNAVGSTTALTSLTTDAAGTTQLGGNVTTSGTQVYNDALSLNADSVLSGSTLHLGGSVDGAHTLAVNGSSGVTLAQAIGATTPLAGLSVTGPLQIDAGAVTTTGPQSYAGATTLGAATTLTGPSIAFGNTLDGAFDLTLQSAGPSSFAAAVGAGTPLASLTANGGGAVQLTGPSIETSGAQSYSGALQLSGSASLTGAALTLSGPVSGASDLTLQTNAFNGGTSIAGTGTLTIAPIDPTLSIGVAGGAGGLQVSQAVLDGAGGFTAHVIGRADGTGTVSSGNLVLRANMTLQTSSGDIDIGGSVDGGFALTLNSGGTTRITGPIGVTTPLASLTTDNNAAFPDWNGTTGQRTTFDTADGTGSARIVTTGAQTYNDPLTASVPIAFTGGAITATQATNRFDGTVSANADSLQLHSSADLQFGAVTLASGGAVDTDGVLSFAGALQLGGGTLVLTSNATPTAIGLTDPDLQGKPYTFGFVPIKEASATIVEEAGATLSSAAGSLIAFRSPNSGTLQLDQPGNTLLGGISAVSGTLDDNNLSRFTNASTLTLGFIRIASSQINVAGEPPSNGDQTVTQAGIEGDVIKLTADVLTTGAGGLIRARLPFNNVQGSETSIPGITFVMTPTALATGGGFGGPSSNSYVLIQVGGAEGGFVTADPKGVGGENAVIFLGGSVNVRPFYDENGKLTEIRVFYNGDAPNTPQEAGALAAVIALIEEMRHARFEEAVRTENVSSRLRSGVIAEVGAGRPATVGRESIRLPETCDVKAGTLRCE